MISKFVPEPYFVLDFLHAPISVSEIFHSKLSLLLMCQINFDICQNINIVQLTPGYNFSQAANLL